ncbi:MAG: hypothetical protein V4568_14735 [Pseudomonadota bacterium]
MQRVLLWTVREPFVLLAIVLLLSGCNDVPRPDTSFCIANVKLLRQECFNLLRDYDSNGMLKKDAKPEIRTYLNAIVMLDALDKSANTDPDGWANLKAYLRNLRAANR